MQFNEWQVVRFHNPDAEYPVLRLSECDRIIELSDRFILQRHGLRGPGIAGWLLIGTFRTADDAQAYYNWWKFTPEASEIDGFDPGELLYAQLGQTSTE